MKLLLKNIWALVIAPLMWVKPSFEGKDGRASSRKLTAFAAFILLAWFTLTTDFTSMVQLYVEIALIGFILIIFGIITQQTISEYIKNKGGNN